jgi:ferritin
MAIQAREEFYHSAKFHHFILERGGRVQQTAIEGPPTDWPSPLAMFEDVLKHEQKVTGLINDLVTQAQAEKDHASNIFLQWFVTEQVEEEATAEDIIQKIKLAGEQGPGLFMVDNELAQRQISPAVSAAMTGAPLPE